MRYTSASLFRRTNRKESPWVGILKYKDEQGHWKEKRKTFSGVKYKRDAKILLNQWRETEETKAEYPEADKSVKEAILSYLRMQRDMNQLSEATYWNDVKMAGWGVFPYFKGRLLGDVTKQELQRYVAVLAKRYKPSSVKTIAAVAMKTFKAAYRMGELPKDITIGLDLPDEKGRRVNYLNKNGRGRFFDLMDPTKRFYLPSMIAFFTGMRAGEICALRWCDIDFENNIIHVSQSVKTYKDGDGEFVVEVSDTKTYKRRTVPLLGQLRTILLEAKGNANENDWVVDYRNPHLMCTSFIKWSTRKQVLGTQDKPITMHGLRHTFATLGVQSKMDIKSLSSILGHASAAMTLDVYASADEEAKQANMLILSNLLEGERVGTVGVQSIVE